MTHTRLLFVSILAGVALPLLPGIASAADCSPTCKISIELPSGNGMPVVDHPVVKADPKAQMDFELKGSGQGSIWIIFPSEGKTPFADNQENLVYSFNVNRLNGSSLKIREFEEGETNPCSAKQDNQGNEYSDCKYIVVDLGRHSRPPLDPYIIIR